MSPVKAELVANMSPISVTLLTSQSEMSPLNGEDLNIELISVTLPTSHSEMSTLLPFRSM